MVLASERLPAGSFFHLRIRYRFCMNRIRNSLRLYYALFRDPRTPKLSKVLPWLLLFYLILPFDVIPDFLPLLGQMDDLLSIPVLLSIAIHLIPESLKREYREKLLH